MTVLLNTASQLLAQAERYVEDRIYWIGREPESLAGTSLGEIRSCVYGTEIALEEILERFYKPPERDFEPLIKPFIRLAKAVTDRTDTEVIFTASQYYTYDVWTDAFFEASTRLQEIAGDEAELVRNALNQLPRIAFVSYPIRADSHTRQHVVVGHEIAHLALLKKDPDDDRSRAYLDSVLLLANAQRPGILSQGVADERGAGADTALSETDAGLSEEETGVPGESGAAAARSVSRQGREGEEESPSEATDNTARLGNWFAELAADLLAVRMVGPAFVLGLADVVLPSHPSNVLQDSDAYASHPPLSWRLGLAAEEAEREFFEARLLKSAKRAAPAVRAVFKNYRERISLHESLEGAALPERELAEREFLVHALELLRSRVNEIIPEGARYRPETFAADLDLIWRKFEQGIAPAERVNGRDPHDPVVGREGFGEGGAGWSMPIDWRSILNAGYFFSAAGESRKPDYPLRTDTATEQEATDDRLVRGSIELAELLRTMQELREQFAGLGEPLDGEAAQTAEALISEVP